MRKNGMIKFRMKRLILFLLLLSSCSNPPSPKKEGLRAVSIPPESPGVLNFAWSLPDELGTGYRFYSSFVKDARLTGTLIGTVTGLNFTADQLTPGTKYYFQVTTIKQIPEGILESPPSNEVSFVIPKITFTVDQGRQVLHVKYKKKPPTPYVYYTLQLTDDLNHPFIDNVKYPEWEVSDGDFIDVDVAVPMSESHEFFRLKLTILVSP